MISFLKGRPRKLMLPNGEEHKAIYAIVDLNDIKASHNEVTFGDTVGYPLENGRNINDRNYKDDISAQRDVQKIAENLNPETLISLSSTPSGTPIINKDGFVVSGNNRVMSLKLATKEYPKNYESYKRQLADDADVFGIEIFDIDNLRTSQSFTEYIDAAQRLINKGTLKIKYDKITSGVSKGEYLAIIDNTEIFTPTIDWQERHGKGETKQAALETLPRHLAEYIKRTNKPKKIEYPILVRIDESLPEKLNTEVLAAFNQDTKKGERPVDKAIKLSSILNSNERCKNAIIHIIDGYDTFSDLYSVVGRNDRKKLAENFVQCGLIPEAQLPIYFDNGEFTENGKDYIETLLSAIILNADALKVLGVEGVKRYRQTLISSLPVLIANETLKEGSLKSDISEAIVLQYKIVQSGGSLSDYTHSQSLFSEDKPSEKGLYLNSLLRVGKNTFKAAIKKYTDAAKSNEGVSLFGENMSIEEIFDKTIKAVVDESDRKNIEQLFKKEEKMTNQTPFREVKEGDYVEVYGYVVGEGVNPIGQTKKIDEGIVTFKYGNNYLNLDNDNKRKYTYSNGYVLKDKKMATGTDFKKLFKIGIGDYRYIVTFNDIDEKIAINAFHKGAATSNLYSYTYDEFRDAKMSIDKELYSAINFHLKQQSSIFEKGSKNKFWYGQGGYQVPQNYSKELIEELKKLGFIISVESKDYLVITKDVTDNEIKMKVYDNGGEFNLTHQGFDFIAAVAYDINTGYAKPKVIAENINKEYDKFFGWVEPNVEKWERIREWVLEGGKFDINQYSEDDLRLFYRKTGFGYGNGRKLSNEAIDRSILLTKYLYIVLESEIQDCEKNLHIGQIIDDFRNILNYKKEIYFACKQHTGKIWDKTFKENESGIERLNTIDSQKEDEINYYKNILNNIEKYPKYNKKNVEKIIAELEKKQTVNGVDVKVLSEEHINPNTDEEFYEELFKQIEPKDDWQGNLIKERDIKQQLNSIVNNATPEDIEELFLNYWAWFNLNKKEEVSEQPKNNFKYYKGVGFAYKNPFEYNKAVEELLDSKNDNFTAEEKVFISNYSGYGGLEKFGAEGKGLLYEYYTPRLIVEKMWGLAYKYGFNGGNVLEPSCGVGEFIKFAPNKELVTGYEINLYSAKIAAILYPEAQIIKEAFETIFIKNRASIKNKLIGVKKYNLVIGNPPYGEFGGLYAGMGEKGYTKAENYIDYFITRGLDLLESNGLLIMIVGAEVASGGKPFLSKGTSKAKQDIMEKSILIDAYRLPNGVFDRTDVLSDIIVLRKK